jgi:hypothetical protein
MDGELDTIESKLDSDGVEALGTYTYTCIYIHIHICVFILIIVYIYIYIYIFINLYTDGYTYHF